MSTYLPRLLAAAKELNIGKDTLVDFLVSKGFERSDLKPTSKLTEEMYQELQKQFVSDKATKNLVDAVELPKTKGELRAVELIERARVEKWTFLDLGNLGLTKIPHELVGLKDQLVELGFGNGYYNRDYRYQYSKKAFEANSITDFSLLGEFRHLTGLYLSENKLRSLGFISFLTQMERLDLESTSIYRLDGIEKLHRLKFLNLSGCKVTDLNKLKGLPKLTYLNLNNCHLKSLDLFSTADFSKLDSLILAENEIGEELDKIAHFKTLRYLSLRQCGSVDIKPLEKLTGLKGLNLASTSVSENDLSIIVRLTGLLSLNLSENFFADLSELKNLVNLQELWLDRNRIDDISALSGLSQLTILSLRENKLSDIIPLGGLTNLENLDLTHNAITDCSRLSGLQKLRMLRLEANEIEDLGPIIDLPGLAFLDLRKNNISDISPIKTLIRNSKRTIGLSFTAYSHSSGEMMVDLSENPIVNPPKQYLDAGLDAILSYWDQQEKLSSGLRNEQIVNEVKLIIVGNSNVGKTTLAYLLRNGKLPGFNPESTHGLEFSTWKPGWIINNVELTVHIIDFGGQEYYHDTHHLFFNDRAVFLLLWEPDTNDNVKKETPVGDRSRTEMVRHFDVAYWLNAIEIYAGMQSLAPVLLVQTHMDKYGKAFFDMQELKDWYHRLADAVSISMEISSGTTRGVNILVEHVKALYEEMPENLGHLYDASWVIMRNHIEAHEKEHYRIMSIAEFRDYFLLYTGGGADYTEEDVRIMCITLNYWGVILYRYEMPELRDIIIINPQYFTGQINRLLTEKIREKNGAISRREVPEVLQETGPEKAAAFIRVLKEFKILFELPRVNEEDEPYYIAPMYLQEKPGFLDLFLDQFAAYYKIKYEGYYHKGILLDCFKELGKDLWREKDSYFYWQWGLVLKKGERIINITFDANHLNQVLIKTIRKDKEILGRDAFLQEVFAAFERINEKYRVDLELSCDGKHFVSKKLLLNEMKAGLYKFDHEGKKCDTRDFSFLLHPTDMPSPFKRVFVSYSSKDRQMLDQLELHLRMYKSAGIIDYWDDLFLSEREGWDQQIKDEMDKANILIMLLSPNYFGTPYILSEEIPTALHHLQAPVLTKQVFWVLLVPCSYELFPNVARYPIFPLKEKEELSGKASQLAISEHENVDREWVKLLKMALEEI